MAASSSSFVSSLLPPALPLSSIATDSNRSIHLLTFAPHSPLFPSLTKPNRPVGPAALRVRAQSGRRELNRGPERPKSSVQETFPIFGEEEQRSRDEIKQDLLKAIDLLDRGLERTERIDQLAAELEAVTPTKEPLKTNSLNGKWELLYPTQKGNLFVNILWKISQPSGKIYQAINTDMGTLSVLKQIFIKAPDCDQVKITYFDEKIRVYKVKRNLFILKKMDR